MCHTTALKRVLLIGLLVLLNTSPVGCSYRRAQRVDHIGLRRKYSLPGDRPGHAHHPFYAGPIMAAYLKHGQRRELEPAQLGLPVSGSLVNALAIGPGHASHPLRRNLLGANGGVFKSTDGGGSWSAANTGLYEVSQCYRLAI